MKVLLDATEEPNMQGGLYVVCSRVVKLYIREDMVIDQEDGSKAAQVKNVVYPDILDIGHHIEL